MYGTMGGVPPEDYALARAIVLWGVNPSATSIHLVPHVRAAQRAGAFVAVDRSAPHAAGAQPPICIWRRARAPTRALALAMIERAACAAAGPTAHFSPRTPTASTRSRAAAAEWPLERAAAECDVPAGGHRGARRRLRGGLAGRGALRLGRRAQPQRRPGRARHPGAAGGGGKVRRARRRLHHEPEPRLPDRCRRAGAPGSGARAGAADQHGAARPRAHRAAAAADPRAVRLQRQSRSR